MTYACEAVFENCTVAILAQGTSWAVADTQALWKWWGCSTPAVAAAPLLSRKTSPSGFMFLKFLGSLPSSDFIAADGHLVHMHLLHSMWLSRTDRQVDLRRQLHNLSILHMHAKLFSNKLYRSHFWLKVQVGLLRARKPYGNGGGVRFLLLPPHPFVETDKAFRIDVSYVSGLFAELRFYSCRWATWSICTFCTACV